MAELEGISADLRRQRKDIAEALESTCARSNQAAELINKIEELRRRADDTLRKQPEPTHR